nr:reverse transcriptase domain-containing protein [Tanacetum cinerariifolium]
MQTKIELALEQSQQGVSNDVLNQRDLPKDTLIDRLEVFRYDTGKRSKVRMRIMPTETELTLEKTPQDGSGAGLILTNPEGMEFIYALRFSMHAGTRSVVAKALRIGYYWPTINKDVRTLIRACQDYQVHKPVPRNPQQQLTSIMSPWSFYKWGIDIAGPFPKGLGKVKFLIVAIDYFIKWIEAKPVDYFNGNQVKNLCGTTLSVDSNSQERSSQILENSSRTIHLKIGIKARLDARSKNWMEELSYVLWAHRTMITSSNRDTPFSLTYGTEALIPTEIGMPTLRKVEVDLVQNNEALEINLDLLEERREQVAIHDAKSKAKMEKYYNSKAQNISFKPDDLVYHNNDASRVKDTGKLGLKWEGPYKVTEALGKGAYKLRDCDGKQLSRTWNVSNLKKCYIHKV